MNKHENALHSQHIQIQKIRDRKELIEKTTKIIETNNAHHLSQIERLSGELAEEAEAIGVNLDETGIELTEGIVTLSPQETAAIAQQFTLPPLEVIRFADWDTFEADCERFLRAEGVDMSADPIFQMLSLGEIKAVIDGYKNDYGEIIPDWKDYGIILIAGIMGAVAHKIVPSGSIAEDVTSALTCLKGSLTNTQETAQPRQGLSDPEGGIARVLGSNLLHEIQKRFSIEDLQGYLNDLLVILAEILRDESDNQTEKLGDAVTRLFTRVVVQFGQTLPTTPHNKIRLLQDIESVLGVDDWMRNSGLNIDFADLVAKMSTEGIMDTVDNHALQMISELLHRLSELVVEDGETMSLLESSVTSLPLIGAFFHEKESLHKLLGIMKLLQNIRENSLTDHDRHLLESLSSGLITQFANLCISLTQHFPDLLSALSRSSAEIGRWLQENGLSYHHLRELSLSSALVEIVIRSWYCLSLYEKYNALKVEPYAVRLSFMLASAHMLANSHNVAKIMAGIPPGRVNWLSLGLATKYGFEAAKEYLRREKQIESDLNRRMNELYRQSIYLAKSSGMRPPKVTTGFTQIE